MYTTLAQPAIDLLLLELAELLLNVCHQNLPPLHSFIGGLQATADNQSR